MNDLLRRITDRSFLLTVTVLILAQLTSLTPEQLLSYIGIIAPFIIGEKWKDAKAIQARLESVKLPETISAGGNVNLPAASALPAQSAFPESVTFADEIPESTIALDENAEVASQ